MYFNFTLIAISGFKMLLVNCRVNMSFAGQEIQGVVHLHLGHGLLGLVEDAVLVNPRLLRALSDQAVHEVVVLVSKCLVG